VRFVAESVIRAPAERVFAFHELPDAVARLTPPWAGSRVVEQPTSLEKGTRTIVDIRVLPLIWIRAVLEHSGIERPIWFEDRQLSGPFRSWRHMHRVVAEDGQARLVDAIDFELPFEPWSRWLAGRLAVRRLERLFAYRHEVTRAWCEGSEGAERTR